VVLGPLRRAGPRAQGRVDRAPGGSGGEDGQRQGQIVALISGTGPFLRAEISCTASTSAGLCLAPARSPRCKAVPRFSARRPPASLRSPSRRVCTCISAALTWAPQPLSPDLLPDLRVIGCIQRIRSLRLRRPQRHPGITLAFISALA